MGSPERSRKILRLYDTLKRYFVARHFSARHLIFAWASAIQHQQLRGHHLGTGTLLAVGAFPVARLQATLHIHPLALAQELVAAFRQVAPGHDVEPLRVFAALALGGRPCAV